MKERGFKYDVIVIGAGINGAGIARDAALSGLKVLLIDKGDIGSGTSSWSTRLIHGGLRYLEHGEIGLVRESLRERETLLKIASHLVAPLSITIPIRKSGKRSRTTIRAGMIAYDLLSWGKSLQHHRIQSKEETLSEIPGLDSSGLLGSAVYFDAQVEFPERLVLENAMSARDHGADIETYACVTNFRVANGRVLAVEFQSKPTGVTWTAQCEVVINAAGPWADQLLKKTPWESPRLIGGTKGSHIVLSKFTDAPKVAVYLEAEKDGRPFFVMPWNHLYLIGTTDVRFENDLDNVQAQMWEIEYLLDETNHAFPRAKLTPGDILYSYSGVRPLPFSDSDDESKITRRHFIREHAELGNLLSVVGGKLTTYRSLAEECIDIVFRKLERKRPKCQTGIMRLPGAARLMDIGDDFWHGLKFSDKVIKRLARIYGACSSDIASLCINDPALAEPFNQDADAIAAELVYAFESEMAVTLSDVLLRRTMLGLNADLAIGDDERAAGAVKQFCGWTDERARKEILDYRNYVKRFRVNAGT